MFVTKCPELGHMTMNRKCQDGFSKDAVCEIALARLENT